MQSGVAATDLAVTVAGGRNDNEIKGGNIMEAPGAPEVIFERVKAQLKARLGAEVYSNWFGSMMLADCSKSVVRLSVPTAFLKLWINNHYADLISELWQNDDANVLKVEIIVRNATRAARPVIDEQADEKPALRRQPKPAMPPAARAER